MAGPGVARFVTRFLLPLVRGGTLHVGRPLGPAAVARMAESLTVGGTGADELAAVAELSRRRQVTARALIADVDAPPLDETTLRLGATLHNLLALAHPAIEGGVGDSRQERIAAVALELGTVGFPRSAVEAVNRHSLLARLPEIARSDRTVHFWLGRRSFIGRVPPRRVTALPRLRAVRVDTVRRSWLRGIGIPASARAAFLALNVASPMGEALDPQRLEPPLSWSRILPVLRFAQLCRLVANHLVEVGIDRCGDALAAALFRFSSLQDPPGGIAASPEGVAFALRFLAHAIWLDVLFAGRPAGPPPAPGSGLELAVVLAAAHQTRPDLVWPPDVSRDSDLGQAFATRLDQMTARARTRAGARLAAALGVARFAAGPPAEIPGASSSAP